MSRPARQPSADNGLLILGTVTLIGAVLGTVWVAVTAGSRLDRVNLRLPPDPFTLFFRLLEGRTVWPTSGTWIAATIGGVLLAAVIAAAVLAGRWRASRSRVDHAAAQMGRGRDLDPLSRRTAAATSRRLGAGSWLGIPIGITVAGRRPLYGSAEDMHVAIAGPRTGKSTSLVIPAILTAPGPVLTTSNKRDVADATRDLRAAAGRVWVFDPQAVAGETATWWWNPLSYVTDDERAAELAAHFAAGARGPDSRQDAYFTPAGQDLLAGLLLAAACAQLPITQVFTWTTQPAEETPAEILRDHGYAQAADAVLGIVYAAPEQRSGVYGTAQQMAACLKSRKIAAWVTPVGGNTATDRRPQFDPYAFAASTDTLYSLSREGAGTAGPLVTALTAATVDAAETLAASSPGGRLAIPMLGILDEAANVCRWASLPDLYSHYGSRGIVLMTVLQSWSQGTEVWGRDGMRKLWSAANVKTYGGGVAEPEFLSELSQLVGFHDRITTSVSRSRTGTTTSRQLTARRTLEVDDLAALPRGRAVVLASGVPAVLVETIPWMRSRHAAAIRASIADRQNPAPSADSRPKSLADATTDTAPIQVLPAATGAEAERL